MACPHTGEMLIAWFGGNVHVLYGDDLDEIDMRYTDNPVANSGEARAYAEKWFDELSREFTE